MSADLSKFAGGFPEQLRAFSDIELSKQRGQLQFLAKATSRNLSSGIAGQRSGALRNRARLEAFNIENLRRRPKNEFISSLGFRQSTLLKKITDPSRTARLEQLDSRLEEIRTEQAFKPRTQEQQKSFFKIPFAREEELKRIGDITKRIFGINRPTFTGIGNPNQRKFAGVVVPKLQAEIGRLQRNIRKRTGEPELDKLIDEQTRLSGINISGLASSNRNRQRIPARLKELAKLIPQQKRLFEMSKQPKETQPIEATEKPMEAIDPKPVSPAPVPLPSLITPPASENLEIIQITEPTGGEVEFNEIAPFLLIGGALIAGVLLTR